MQIYFNTYRIYQSLKYILTNDTSMTIVRTIVFIFVPYKKIKIMKKVYLIFVAGTYRVVDYKNDNSIRNFYGTDVQIDLMIKFLNDGNYEVHNKSILMPEYREKLKY